MGVIHRCLGVIGLSIASLYANAQDAEYLVDLDCSNIESLLPSKPIEKEVVDSLVDSLTKTSVLRYLTGDDSYFEDYYKVLKDRRFLLVGLAYSDELEKLKASVIRSDQKLYLQELREKTEETQKLNFEKYWLKINNNPYRAYARKSSDCALKEIAQNKKTNLLNPIKELIEKSKSKTREDLVGYFSIKINKCYVSGLPITGNQFTEPKKWPGSRFVVIDALYKNQDSEGRLPAAGSLMISHKGRELRYDDAETIMQEGYGIYFKSVNPLVSMPTKIVYRIPNEVSGEVSWEPGRNNEGKRLWCTFVSAEAQ